MSQRNHVARAVLGLLTAVLVAAGSSAWAADGVLYNKYNIHSQYAKGVYKASYANYVDPGAGHTIFPPNTPLRVGKVSAKRMELYAQKDGEEMEILFEFHEPRMEMSAEAYLELITSTSPVSLDDLSAADREGVNAGKARVGMSKKGVMTALGYPATHKTPSPESPSWVYWTNRFGTLRVDFDDSGTAVGVTD